MTTHRFADHERPSTHEPVPDEDASLSEGILVETSLVARVFGIKLLTLDGTIVLSPARIRRIVGRVGDAALDAAEILEARTRTAVDDDAAGARRRA